MCVVSMVGDHYGDKWGKRWPLIPDRIPSLLPIDTIYPDPVPEVSRAEFDELKKEVAEMIALLKRAKKYDKDNGEPDCELDEKMALLRKVAKLVGVDLDKALQQ